MARGNAKKKDPEGNAPVNVVEMGGNISGLLESVAKARDKIINIDAKIKELQADKKAIRESMESKGITKKAFDKALAYFRESPEQREGFDTSYAIAREGMGLPIKGEQLGLFNKDEGETDGNAKVVPPGVDDENEEE